MSFLSHTLWYEYVYGLCSREKGSEDFKKWGEIWHESLPPDPLVPPSECPSTPSLPNPGFTP